VPGSTVWQEHAYYGLLCPPSIARYSFLTLGYQLVQALGHPEDSVDLAAVGPRIGAAEVIPSSSLLLMASPLLVPMCPSRHLVPCNRSVLSFDSSPEYPFAHIAPGIFTLVGFALHATKKMAAGFAQQSTFLFKDILKFCASNRERKKLCRCERNVEKGIGCSKATL
jgi:hypothetical protein